MIDLKIQIISILFSFVFGFVFYILVFINKRVLFNVKKYIQIVSTFLFMFDMSLLYFICNTTKFRLTNTLVTAIICFVTTL